MLSQDERLAEALDRLGPSELLLRGRGAYAFVALDAAENVTALSDPLGLCPMYVASGQGVEIVGSHAGLVAWALAEAEDGRPAPDLPNLAWLALGGIRYDSSTGYSGVSLSGAGEEISISRTARRTVRTVWRPPWHDAPPPAALPQEAPAAIGSAVVGEIVESIEAGIRLVAPAKLEVDLTGGHDTRLILAAILHAGLEDRCVFGTIGPDDLPDVGVARLLAERYGLEHRQFLPDRETLSDAAELERTVTLTEAMTSAIRRVPLHRGGSPLRVSGIFDGFRARRVFQDPNVSTDHVRGIVAARMLANRLELIDGDLVSDLRNRAIESVMDARDAGHDSGAEVMDRLWLQFGLRQHIGPMQAFTGPLRTLPQYSARLVDLAYKYGSVARQKAVFYQAAYDLVPGLKEVPFSEEYAATRIGGVEPVTAGRQENVTPLRRDQVPTIGKRGRAARAAGRAQLFRTIADQAPASVWQVIDRRRFYSALDAVTPLKPAEERELYGATTALIWCRLTDPRRTGM